MASRTPFSSDDSDDISSLTGGKIFVDRISATGADRLHLKVGTGAIEIVDGKVELKSGMTCGVQGITFSDNTVQTTASSAGNALLSQLGDVDVFLLSNNSVLKYNANLHKWIGDYVRLAELGDTNISALNNGNILRYNSIIQKWETDTFTLTDLDNVNITSVANNESLKYNSTSGKWENFSPSYLDGAGILNNNLIKVSNGVTTKTSFYETSVLNTSTSFQTYIPSGLFDILAGSIEAEIFETTKQRMRLTTSGIATSKGVTITSDGEVDIVEQMTININGVTIGGDTTVNGAITGGSISSSGHVSLTGSAKITLMNGQDGGTGRGLFLWESGNTSWGIYMGQPGSLKSLSGGNAPAGYGFAGHTFRCRVFNMIDKGFVWENSSGIALMSLRASDGLCYIKGNLFCNGALRFTSDDRLKFDEQVLTDGLAVVRQLSPQVYLKSTEMDVQTNSRKEIGFIAQEVQRISQLAHTVAGEPPATPPIDGQDPSAPSSTGTPTNSDGPLSVDYTQIFVYAIQAIKELDRKVLTLEARITALGG